MLVPQGWSVLKFPQKYWCVRPHVSLLNLTVDVLKVESFDNQRRRLIKKKRKMKGTKHFSQKIFTHFLLVKKVNNCNNGSECKTSVGEDCFTLDWRGVTESTRLELLTLLLSQTTSDARQLLLTILHFIDFNLQLSREKKFNILVKTQGV